jgi:peptidoglycan/LPS O-acetylase OafA/YrhL
MAVVYAVAATPAFRWADTPSSPHPNRVTAIDGLRGFLALGVVFSHVAVYHEFLLSGRWRGVPTNFYLVLGPVSVSLFFMITGYLFWGRLVRTQGRPGWVALYVNRFFRIGPLYLAAVVAMLAAVGVLTGWHRHVSGLRLAHEAGRWAIPFGIVIGGVVNGYADTSVLLANVTWSIQYEWWFYFSLPVLSLASRSRRWHLPAVVVGCMIWLASGERGMPVALFLCGMLCASLQERGLLVKLPDRVGSLLVIVLLAGVFQFHEMVTRAPIALLGLILYLIVSGTSVFGLLESRPARRLGDISYGIYLLQGLVLAAVYWPIPMKALALESPIYHWGLALVAALISIAVAMVAHVAIERPGIALGRHINKRTFHFFKISKRNLS